MKKAAYMFALVLILTSCQKEFRIKGLDTRPRAMIEFIPCSLDSSYVKVFKALPVQTAIDDGSSDSYVDDPASALTIEVNGERVEAVNAGKSLSYVYRRFSPGEEVTVRVRLDGTDEAEARTVIPPGIPEFRVERDGDYLVLTYRSDGGVFPEYMGMYVRFLTRTITCDEKGNVLKVTDTERSNHMYLDEDSGSGGIVPLIRGSVKGQWFGDGRLYYWKESCSTDEGGGWHSMRLPYSRIWGGFEDIEYDQVTAEWETDEESGDRTMVRKTLHVMQCNDFEFTISGLHEDLFRYLSNCDDIAGNDMGQSGLAPTVFNWTNVKGGFGIAAGMSCTKSGWMNFEGRELICPTE